MRRQSGFIKALAAAFVVFLATGCSADPTREDVEVARVTSPNGAIDAVLTEANPGATASFVYRIRLIPRGAAWKNDTAVVQLYGATRNASAFGVDLKWQDARTLVAEYLQARSVSLTESAAEDVSGHKASIILRDGVENPAAPPGGMAAAVTPNPTR